MSARNPLPGREKSDVHMNSSMARTLQALTWDSDGVEYRLLQLPRSAHMAAAGVFAQHGEPFAMLIHAKDEVTLVLPADAIAEYEKRIAGYTDFGRAFRLISFYGVDDPNIIGFMAALSTALAAAGVFIIPIGAFTRDHVLVFAEQLDTAFEALRKLQALAR
jgi:hypothetical protein